MATKKRRKIQPNTDPRRRYGSNGSIAATALGFETTGGLMNDSIGEITVARARPLDRARAISGLISEEALASERLGRLTDKVAAALLDANLFSIRLPQADG